MFTVTTNDDEVRQALSQLQQCLQNMQPVMNGIGEKIIERSKHRFDTKTTPAGGKWTDWSEETIKIIAARINGKGDRKKDGTFTKKGADRFARRTLLVDSEQLMRQFDRTSDSNSVTVSNTTIYAAIHQFGGTAGRNRKVQIPARPFLPISSSGQMIGDEDKNDILQAIQNYLTGI